MEALQLPSITFIIIGSLAITLSEGLSAAAAGRERREVPSATQIPVLGLLLLICLVSLLLLLLLVYGYYYYEYEYLILVIIIIIISSSRERREAPATYRDTSTITDMYVCMIKVCTYACVYIYIYIYTHIMTIWCINYRYITVSN